MLSYATLFLAAAAAVSSVDAHTMHRRDHRLIAREVTKPDTYFEGYLEPYKTYHTRYLALDCQDKHNTTFFDDCCHPMLATETLQKNRKAYCTPGKAQSSSAAAAEPTSTVVPDDGDDDCEPEEDQPSSIVKVVKPTSTKAPEPAKTTSKMTTKIATSTKDASSSSKAPEKTATSGGGKFDIGSVHTGGIATFFSQGGVAGACGTVHSDSDFVAAMTSSFYGSFSKKSDICGRKILITRLDDGRQVTVTVADGCPTCETPTSIDLSKAAFLKIATENEGIANIKWEFTN